MTEDGAAGAVEHLVDAARLWAVKPGGDTEPVIRAACDALVVGLDGPNLVSLASTSFGPIDWDFQDVLKTRRARRPASTRLGTPSPRSRAWTPLVTFQRGAGH